MCVRVFCGGGVCVFETVEINLFLNVGYERRKS